YAAALIEQALAAHPLLPLAARLGDRASRRWLERQNDPYLPEIRHIAERLGRPGAFFLNIIYEWACSTSVAPDPAGRGMRLIRVLDWGLTGIGRYLVLARFATAVGPFVSATWPGYAGVLTAMAPGRFAAAINQAPRLPQSGIGAIDEVLNRWRMLRLEGALPSPHLLRRVCETARDYAAALAILADERIKLAMPALFILSGIAEGEGAVVEAWGNERRIHPATAARDLTVGVANDWLNREWRGSPRRHAAEWEKRVKPRENNRIRRDAVCALQRGDFAGAASLAAPVLNGHTVLVAAMNAATGALTVEALDHVVGAGPMPQVVARRALAERAPAATPHSR
ncbi:MAG TPA: hypothetical protein VLX85_03315, partial [Stellaceae bacterium]|nr:hypothetical protein [Stellaceae bacterium]